MNLRKLYPAQWFGQEDEGRSPAVRRHEATPRQVFHTEVDRMFDDMFNSFFSGMPARQSLREAVLKPNLDLHSTDKEYLISIELPGVDENDVSLDLTGNVLVISGEKKSETRDEKNGVHRMERSYGSFRRTLELPEDARGAEATAKFDKGVLSISIPRETIERKKITIAKS